MEGAQAKSGSGIIEDMGEPVFLKRKRSPDSPFKLLALTTIPAEADIIDLCLSDTKVKEIEDT